MAKKKLPPWRTCDNCSNQTAMISERTTPDWKVERKVLCYHCRNRHGYMGVYDNRMERARTHGTPARK